MIYPDFDQLLTKYGRKALSASEFDSFKEQLNQTDDASLRNALYLKWENETHDGKPTDEEVKQMLIAIRKKTYPRSSSHFPRWVHLAGVAAVAVVLLLIGFSGYLYVDRNKLIELAQNEIVVKTEVGQRTQVTLPDGSVVRLNSESQLSYTQSYGLDNRSVGLTGEGYFQVKKNPTKQFIVRAAEVEVKVLGTTFNARAYKKMDEIEITLVNGSVELLTHTDPIQTARLKPNDKGVFNKLNGTLMVKHSENEIETAWVANKLVFRSTSLEEIFAKVQRRYGVQISVNSDALLNDMFTGTFDVESIGEVMNALQKHYGFIYQIKENNIQVRFTK